MDAAASMIEKAIIANPTYAEAYNNLGLYLYLSGVFFYWNFAIHIRWMIWTFVTIWYAVEAVVLVVDLWYLMMELLSAEST